MRISIPTLREITGLLSETLDKQAISTFDDFKRIAERKMKFRFKINGRLDTIKFRRDPTHWDYYWINYNMREYDAENRKEQDIPVMNINMSEYAFYIELITYRTPIQDFQLLRMDTDGNFVLRQTFPGEDLSACKKSLDKLSHRVGYEWN
ncbi:MAG: hypothetical protein AABX11_02085 [Nanoarchaeota archaeon]